MKVLVACEFSGVVREAFRKKGHDAWSCDFLPADDKSEHHFQQDVLEILYDDCWDMLIAHPPCTYLANSGVHLLHKDESRWDKLLKGAIFFRTMLCADIDKICVENPVMHKYALEHIGSRHTQTIQPWQFGEDASKRTCLWLKNLPKLEFTKVIKKERYANQTPSGRNNLPPSKDRWKLRSITYQGIADAMATQWSEPELKLAL